MKSFRSKYLSILSAVVGIMTFVFSVNAEEWKLHPSFDRTPLRIIDTPEDTYFLVHQQIYDKSKVGYDFPSLTLFRYNKNATDKGITPLVHDVQLTSADIRMADYSPKGDYLIVVYNDGGIDLIDKDMHLTHIDKLKRYTIPGMAKVTSVSFEPSTGDAWIGTDAGYMHVDAVSFTIQDVKVFDRGIDRICKFGDKLVALSGNAAWQSDVVNPLTFNEFKKISSVGSPSIMLPLGENEFAYVYGAPGSNSPINRVLKLARFDNSSWKVTDLGQDSFYSLSNNGTVVDRYESNFIPNKDGYLIYSVSKAWQLYAPKDDESTRLVSISLDSNPLSLGSWDFSNFWCYRDRGTFVLRHADFTMDSNATSAAATWTDMQDPIRPNAPAAFICTYMDYSPKYGLLAMNHGVDWNFTYVGAVVPNLLSGLNNNKWSVYSQTYEMPYSIENNSELRSKYTEFYPIYSPKGVCVDPLNPDKVWISSMFGGIMVMDLSDVKKDVIRFGTEKDPFNGFPGFIPAMPDGAWGSHCAFAPVRCDSENRLWTIFYARGQNRVLHLKYMNDNRLNDFYGKPVDAISEEKAWNTIVLPYEGDASSKCLVLPLFHERNKNKLMICTGLSTDVIILYDHKGTLDNIEDDTYEEIRMVRMPTENKVGIYGILNIIEDPINGDVLILTSGETITVSANLDVINSEVKGNHFNVMDNDLRGVIPSAVQINSIVYDEYERMWIATNNQGLIEYSPKDNQVNIYNTENSPLLSDCVYGLGWDMSTQSLMVSTKLGMVQLFPDIASAVKAKKILSVAPNWISPDFNGNVNINNIPYFSQVIVRDKDGNVVNVLENENSSNIQWNLCDKTGKKIKSGIYTICTKDSNSVELIMMSFR